MTIDWSTLGLELINFLVLLWLLKRILYRPVRQALAKRQAEVRATLETAEQKQREAETLRQDTEGRLQAWQQEQEAARAALAEELKAERSQRMAVLDGELMSMRQKSAVLAQREREAEVAHTQLRALQAGAEFASRLLGKAAGPDLEQRLIDLFLEQVVDLPDPVRRRLIGAEGDALRVESAYELSRPNRDGLTQVLRKLLGDSIRFEFEQRPDLVAGVRISAGGQVLGANVADELRAFAELAQWREVASHDGST